LGVSETILAPVGSDEICAFVNAAAENGDLSSGPAGTDPIPLEFEEMLGISLPMREVFQRILVAASADVSVLITGETGTGKDLVAAAIHKRSSRRQGPYVPVNTGAMPVELIASQLFGHEKGAFTGAANGNKGHFETADGGSIFLDEICTMDERAQVSLLRVLETRTFRRLGGEKDIRVDVRVIAATNENLEEAVKEKRFREDLFFRLDVFRIHVPPLRERPGGVTMLTSHFVALFNRLFNKRVKTVSPEAFRLLRRYPWPGNVRELKNVIQRAVLMAKGEELTADLLPSRVTAAGEPQEPDGAGAPFRVGMKLETVEKACIRATLEATAGNKKEAALLLGISRRALYNKLKKHGLL
jgi:DNA-binding NtrC family response regulator